MRARFEEPLMLISSTIIDREPIFRWGRTHQSHERFSRRKWGPLWRCRRSVGCTTATNDGLPEKANASPWRAVSPWALASLLRTLTSANFVHETQAAPHCINFRFVCRYDIRHELHRIFGRDRWWVDVDRLHDILQTNGPEVLGEAMEEGLKEQRFDVGFVEHFLQGKLPFCEVRP
jgi:hypothetical protein